VVAPFLSITYFNALLPAFFLSSFIRNNLFKSTDNFLELLGMTKTMISNREFDIARNIKNLELKIKLIKNTIRIYNDYRPHLSNHMLTPIKMNLKNNSCYIILFYNSKSDFSGKIVSKDFFKFSCVC